MTWDLIQSWLNRWKSALSARLAPVMGHEAVAGRRDALISELQKRYQEAKRHTRPSPLALRMG